MRRVLGIALVFAAAAYFVRQCRKPSGPLGRFLLLVMNRTHSGLTAWGLSHVQPSDDATVLDIGCGGGRTVERLALAAAHGKVYGVDYSTAAVHSARARNRAEVESGRVSIRNASVSSLPFPDREFDLVTAVETHYYWPDRSADAREVLRVLKPGGRLLVIAETYRGEKFGLLNRFGMTLVGGAHLTVDEHRDWLREAGFADVEAFVNKRNGWICVMGIKPA